MTEVAGLKKIGSRFTSPLNESGGVLNYRFESIAAQIVKFHRKLLFFLIKYIKNCKLHP